MPPALLRALAGLLCLAPARAAAEVAWQTSQAGERLRYLGAFAWSPAPPAGAAVVLQADFATRAQTIVGFGGARALRQPRAGRQRALDGASRDQQPRLCS